MIKNYSQRSFTFKMSDDAELQQLRDILTSEQLSLLAFIPAETVHDISQLSLTDQIKEIHRLFDIIEDTLDSNSNPVEYDAPTYWRLPFADIQLPEVDSKKDVIDRVKSRVERIITRIKTNNRLISSKNNESYKMIGSEISISKEIVCIAPTEALPLENQPHLISNHTSSREESGDSTIILRTFLTANKPVDTPAVFSVKSPLEKEVNENADNTQWVAYGNGWVSIDYMRNKKMRDKRVLQDNPDLSSTNCRHADLLIKPEEHLLRIFRSNNSNLAMPAKNQVKPSQIAPNANNYNQLVGTREPKTRPFILNVRGVPNFNLSTPRPADISHSTLGPESIESILGEIAKSAYQESENYTKAEKRKHSGFTIKFRILNLIRALSVASFGIYSAINSIYSSPVQVLGAAPVFIAMVVFYTVDILVSIVKSFPRSLWLFWDIKTFDAFEESNTIWALVADHDLLTDIVPLVMNMSLEIYAYRIAELIANPNAQDSICKTLN